MEIPIDVLIIEEVKKKEKAASPVQIPLYAPQPPCYLEERHKEEEEKEKIPSVIIIQM